MSSIGCVAYQDTPIVRCCGTPVVSTVSAFIAVAPDGNLFGLCTPASSDAWAEWLPYLLLLHLMTVTVPLYTTVVRPQLLTSVNFRAVANNYMLHNAAFCW
jgi:hypothetical protein